MPLDGAAYAGRAFSSADKARISALRDDNVGWPGIAAELKRTAGAVRMEWLRMQDRAAESAEVTAQAARLRERPCLRCRNSFMSQHAGHRMCDACRAEVAEVSPFELDAGCACDL